MLLFHLLTALLLGVLAALLSLRAGASGGAAMGWYVLVGMGSLGVSAVVDRWWERLRARRAEQAAPERVEPQRGAILFLLVSLLAVAGVLLANRSGLLAFPDEEHPPFLAGLMDPILSLDHPSSTAVARALGGTGPGTCALGAPGGLPGRHGRGLRTGARPAGRARP